MVASRQPLLICLVAVLSFVTLGQQTAFNSTTPSIKCQVLVAHIQYSTGVADQTYPDTEYDCLPLDAGDGLLYNIPTSLLQPNLSMYQNGDAVIEIVGGQAVKGQGNMSEYEIVLVENAYVVFIETLANRRAMAQLPARPSPKIGTRTVLIVRVTASGSTIPVNSATIANQAFGTGFSLRTIYGNCSWNQLKFVPAAGRNINKGVYELSVNISTYNTSRLTLENAMTKQLLSEVGSISKWDHVLYCVPQPSASWIAYAYIGSNRAFFNGNWCSYPSSLVHEVGHNLGLVHSWEDGHEYYDRTGYMGFSYASLVKPSMCFNGHKHWLLGWHKSIQVYPAADGPWAGKLVAFTDADKITSADQYIVVNILDLYIQYNAAKSFNSGVQAFRDKVTIVQANDRFSHSNFMANLSATSQTTYRYSDVVIQLCSKTASSIEQYVMSIHLISQSPTCSPVPSPSQPINRAQAAQPMLLPTARHPLHRPLLPTLRPSRKPVLPSRNPLTPTNKPVSPTRQPRRPSSKPVLPSRKPWTPINQPLSPTNQALQHSSQPVVQTRPVSATPRVDSPTPKPQLPTRHPRGPSINPAAVRPSSAVHSPECYDSLSATFFVQRTGKLQSCVWLSYRPSDQAALCKQSDSSKAYNSCPATCGKCFSNCTDSQVRFKISGKTRDCVWLSLRPSMQEMVCTKGSAVTTLCPKTCRTCYN